MRNFTLTVRFWIACNLWVTSVEMSRQNALFDFLVKKTVFTLVNGIYWTVLGNFPKMLINGSWEIRLNLRFR